MVKRYLIMADWRRQIQLFLTMPDIGYLVNVMIVYGMICLKFRKKLADKRHALIPCYILIIFIRYVSHSCYQRVR